MHQNAYESNSKRLDDVPINIYSNYLLSLLKVIPQNLTLRSILDQMEIELEEKLSKIRLVIQ